jgi:hypothetical protein
MRLRWFQGRRNHIWPPNLNDQLPYDYRMEDVLQSPVLNILGVI